MVRTGRRKVENHDSKALVLTESEDACHLRFSVWYPVLLLVHGLDTLSKHEEGLVDSGAFDQALLIVFGAAVVFRTGKIDT